MPSGDEYADEMKSKIADLRVIQAIGDRTHRRIDSQVEVGGWPELKSAVVPSGTDRDCMADDWERRYGLNPKDASDCQPDKDNDGYTNLEEYLSGTDPAQLVDYTKPENNLNTLHDEGR